MKIEKRKKGGRMHTSLWAMLVGIFVLSATACDRVKTEASVYGFDTEDVRVEQRGLGRLTAEERSVLKAMPDTDGTSFIDAKCGDENCRVVELLVFVQNTSPKAIAPPVLRLVSPEGRPRRLPVASRVKKISPGARGKIKWLVSLWPEEDKIELSLSPSVFIDIQ